MKLLEFLNASPDEKRPYFAKAESQLGISSYLIEKDLWVSFILYLLFRDPDLSKLLTFKGGTSLSKCYGIIDRFSEDIDLTISKEAAGISKDHLPNANDSGNQKKRKLEALNQLCSIYVMAELRPNIVSLISKCLTKNSIWSLEPDSEDKDGLTLLFNYPTVAEQAGYIKPAVKLEFGAKGEQWPTETCTHQSYLEKALPEAIGDLKVDITVLAPERTLWEKATIIHSMAKRANPKVTRQSRHLYDFYCLKRSDFWMRALHDIELLRDVCNHKMLYFSSAGAQFEEVLEGKITLMPPMETLKLLRDDYEKMEEMLFGTPVSWQDIVTSLNDGGKTINRYLKDRVST